MDGSVKKNYHLNLHRILQPCRAGASEGYMHILDELTKTGMLVVGLILAASYDALTYRQNLASLVFVLYKLLWKIYISTA